MSTTSTANGSKRSKTKTETTLPLNRDRSISLFSKRLTAKIIEIALLGTSVLVPYSIGVYVESQTNQPTVPLHPVLAEVEESLAQTFGVRPNLTKSQQVNPWTNVLWWTALTSPVLLSSWQIYLLGRKGKTSVKNWLGLKVIDEKGKSPGLIRAIYREGVGQWGIPLSSAYLIWRYFGAFPDLGVLVGISTIAIMVEAGAALFSYRGRTLHDRLAGTMVVDVRNPLTIYPPQERNKNGEPPLTVELQNYRYNSSQQLGGSNKIGDGNLTTIVLANAQEKQQLNLWQWMLEHPVMTLSICSLGGIGAVLTTFVATQVYIQGQTNQRQFQQQNNEVFLSLVNRLSATSADPQEERRSVILTLARLDDPRAVPLLVDLLGQEKNPTLMDTIQQALASVGPSAIPSLRSLNQSLDNELKALSKNGYSSEQELTALKLRASKQAIAKLLTLHSGKLANTSLHNTNLGIVTNSPAQFNLILDRVDLSGIDLRGSILNNASFQGAIFASAGEDARIGTFDDWLADLSYTNFTGANLNRAVLSNVSMEYSNLILANLNRANLSAARLKGSNFSSSQLRGANLQQANLEKTSLTGADLAEAKFNNANLSEALLGQVRAIGADFSFANLWQSNWQGADLSEANFTSANLQQADFSSTQLRGANLQNAQLQNASLVSANLSNVDLRGANLDGANFQGVNFLNAQTSNAQEFVTSSSNQSFTAKIAGVNFARVKNLNNSQIDFICKNGGYHPQCK